MLKALTLLLVLRMMTACAQFELGRVEVRSRSSLRVRVGSSGRPYVKNDHPVLPSFTIAFRDRSKTKGNLFMEFTWMRRMFFAHLDNSGRGGGTWTDLDVKLDHLYLAFGPEWGQGRSTFRVGMQFGAVLGGSAIGTQQGWSMHPQPGGNPQREIRANAGDYFGWDLHLLLAVRITRPITDRLLISLEPCLAPAISPFFDDGNTISSIDFGIRVNILRTFKARGLWPRIRPEPIERTGGSP
ncbi:MAG: hypothetical protein IPG92_02640 [Flavobacteriales bacterium]|nr:hypothetical protein [Flavobacteriales bacterium]